MLVVLSFWFSKLLCHFSMLVGNREMFANLKSRCPGQVLNRLQGSSSAGVLGTFLHLFLPFPVQIPNNHWNQWKIKCKAATFLTCSNEWKQTLTGRKCEIFTSFQAASYQVEDIIANFSKMYEEKCCRSAGDQSSKSVKSFSNHREKSRCQEAFLSL